MGGTHPDNGDIWKSFLANNGLVTEKKLGIAEIHLCWLEI
jgi:hypothetical protein